MEISLGRPIELFDPVENEVVISFKEGLEGDPFFNKKYEFLIADLKRGIRLPEALRKKYGNKLIILPGDKGFGFAFYHLYFPSNLAGGGTYIWRSSDK